MTLHDQTPDRPTRLPRAAALTAHAGLVLTVAGSLALLLSGVGTRWDWWDYRTGFLILRWTLYGGLAVIVVALAGLILGLLARTGRSLLVSLVTLVLLAAVGRGWSLTPFPHEYTLEFFKQVSIETPKFIVNSLVFSIMEMAGRLIDTSRGSSMGEVLDPLKLLNSYGFGLCYQIAPLLEAVFEAGGFPDARVWFLTGHTVTEVFYEGAYHHYDSDMLGYNPVGKGDPSRLPVASVHQIEKDGGIILGKLKSPREVDKSLVDYPWYPADLREAAMGGLAELFTTAKDNWLFPHTRFPQGHTMDFVLRPGERMIRNFTPEPVHPYYLPYKFVAGQWMEFPQEIKQYQIRTEDGPHSQRDARRWATGQIQYRPVLSDRAAYYPAFAPGFNENLELPAAGGSLTRKIPAAARAVFDMPSPYVVIDADVTLAARPTASAAMPMRPASNTVMAILKPSPSSPRRFSTGIR